MSISVNVLGRVFELEILHRNGERLPSALWLRVGGREWWVAS